MIYRKLSVTYSGAAFLELANFYFQLLNSGGLHKLYKDTTKKPEYKSGITAMLAMFNSDGPPLNPRDSLNKGSPIPSEKQQDSRKLKVNTFKWI